jgi:hypothetical protein
LRRRHSDFPDWLSINSSKEGLGPKAAEAAEKS